MIGTVEATQVVALQTGTLEWDQPQTQRYQAGTPLPVTLRVTNPTTGAREYGLYLGLYDPQTRQLIPGTERVVTVDNQESFSVPAQSYVQLQGDLTVDRTGVILGLSLYDVAAAGVVAQVATLLEGPAAAPPGAGLDLIPLLGGVMAIGMIGAIMPLATRMFQEE